ncbi:MAG: 3-hydroxyacyl-CoA dehydrogenase NAD-binding domain-containing protein [Cyclobacteriaceae bacterium]|jgi:3-hydroxybutyryl-CoA dehydrogenase|nr:3-hydroxyacyl-CoA dehydrogenase NAD-binding domain-containing protein [Cyclobacteriaceae bacterium]
MAKTIQHILVCGAGTMGLGIAQTCAQSGYNVYLYDANPEIAQNGIQQIEKQLHKLKEKGKLNADEVVGILQNLQSISKLETMEVDLVIEAIIEDVAIKRNLFATLEDVLPKDAILSSNTSSLPITQLATQLKRASRFAGLHFFNPATVMKLVEVIEGAATDKKVIDQLIAFTLTLNKVPVVAKDFPGFIVNRVARHFYVEALKLLEEGVATHEQIDTILKANGFKLGPFELMDLIGNDINFAVTKSLFDGFHQEPRFRPSRIQQQKVLAKHLGKKTGKGFYDYNS